MFLLISLVLAAIYTLLKPLGDRLYDTSKWVARILAPADMEDNETGRQFVRISQAALMEGWLSNVPFIESLCFYFSLIAGTIYHWWCGLLMVFVIGFLGMNTKRVWGRSVPHYLAYLFHKMANRAADYRKENDTERLSASESLCDDLTKLIVLYEGSRLGPLNPKQLKKIPFGDVHYWLEHGADNA